MKFLKHITKPFLFLLTPLVFLYSLILYFRKRFYELRIFKVHSSEIPIISVGNCALGGQGKTPLCDYIGQYLINKGKILHLSMRGHKSSLEKKGGFLKIDPFGSKNLQLDANYYSDEAIVHYHQLSSGSISIGKNRWQMLLKNLHHHSVDYTFPDVILMDDGFQHLKIEKKLNIVLLHTNLSLKDYKLFPLGKLRDSVHSLQSADLLCINHGFRYDSLKEKELLDFLASKKIVKNHVNIYFKFDPPFIPQEYVELNNLIAFSALANNSYFLQTLNFLGFYPKNFIPFKDHFAYPIKHVENIFLQYNPKSHYFLTSQKDYYKVLPHFSQKGLEDRLYFLNMFLDFPTSKDRDILHEVLESARLKLS